MSCIDNVTYVKKMCNLVSNFNPYYVKLLQWGILDKYEDDEELAEYLRNFINKVPYNISDIDVDVLENAIDYANSVGKKLVIHDIETPYNSGTISVVFKGMLDDKSVIIKLKRPNIQETIEKCISNMLFFTGIMYNINYYIYGKKCINAGNLVLYNKDALVNQCDFTKEVDNILLFNEKYKNSKRIIIPSVFQEFTNNNNDIIIMDYLDGKTMFEITDYDEITEYSYIFNALVFNAFMCKRLSHMDLHIGNILFMRDDDGTPKIGLIDFGMIHKLTKWESKFLLKGVEYISKCEYIKLLTSIATHIYDKDKADDNIQEHIDIIIDTMTKAHDEKQLLGDGCINEKDLMFILRLFYKYDIDINHNFCSIILMFICVMRLYLKFACGKQIIDIYDDILIPSKLKIVENCGKL
jgi:predicted unusual protein kinase regulating ubiquinone biosynthesis (AarF/ABC1/UbiB family)